MGRPKNSSWKAALWLVFWAVLHTSDAWLAPACVENRAILGRMGSNDIHRKKFHLIRPANDEDGRAHHQWYGALRVRGGSSPTTVTYGSVSTQQPMLSAAAASLLAGSVAGAVGVGVAFPLDTLKTKAQVMETETKLTMTQVIRAIYKQDGVKGFFGGVRGMMLGQAVIKSVAFGCNAITLGFLQHHFPAAAPALLLISAACFAGFVTSFFVTPVERVKVMMQASSGVYRNEIDCLQAILRREGWSGLLGRGLGPTLIRETPSYGIYFFIYGYLMQTPLASALGGIAPLVFGALSGCACWIPVYPVDVVKTIVQNTEGDDISSLQVTKDLYEQGGIGAFFDGLTPKMLRAATNHAVTFYVYDLVQGAFAAGLS